MENLDGFILLNQQIQEHPVWNDYLAAGMLLHVALKAQNEQKNMFGIEVKSGQLLTTYNGLCRETGYNNKQTTKALKTLESFKMIRVEKIRKYLIITLTSDKYIILPSENDLNEKKISPLDSVPKIYTNGVHHA